METCENCLHHLACLINSEYVTSPCPAYKDKADVVEVVRCKDCIHRNPYGYKCLRDNLWHDTDDFCSYGTPKERGGEK